MKKSICRAFAIAFAVSIMLTTVIPASAAQPPVIMPAYVGITDLFSGLTISSNGKASCKATAYNNGTHDVTLTIALKQDGSTIKSWNVVTTDGFNSVEKNYFVTSGHIALCLYLICCNQHTYANKQIPLYPMQGTVI